MTASKQVLLTASDRYFRPDDIWRRCFYSIRHNQTAVGGGAYIVGAKISIARREQNLFASGHAGAR